MEPLISFAEFARRMKCSRAAVTKAVNIGRLSESVIESNSKRMLDPVLAKKEWKMNSDPSYNRRDNEESNDQEIVNTFSPEKIPPMQFSRARKLHYEAEKVRLEALAKAGSLIEKEDFENASIAFMDMIQEGIDEMIHKLEIRLRPLVDKKYESRVEKILSESQDRFYRKIGQGIKC